MRIFGTSPDSSSRSRRSRRTRSLRRTSSTTTSTTWMPARSCSLSAVCRRTQTSSRRSSRCWERRPEGGDLHVRPRERYSRRSGGSAARRLNVRGDVGALRGERAVRPAVSGRRRTEVFRRGEVAAQVLICVHLSTRGRGASACKPWSERRKNSYYRAGRVDITAPDLVLDEDLTCKVEGSAEVDVSVDLVELDEQLGGGLNVAHGNREDLHDRVVAGDPNVEVGAFIGDG